ILRYGGQGGYLLLRREKDRVDVLAVDAGRGIHDLYKALELWYTTLRILGWKFGTGIGLSWAREIAVFGGRGQLTLASNHRQVTVTSSANDAPVQESSIGPGTVVLLQRYVPASSEEAAPWEERLEQTVRGL